MRISIVIPTLNEIGTIRSTLAIARGLAGDFEILVVDGGSEDGTVEAVREAGVAYHVVEPGRARQMNEGARRAGGECLLFLHADTALPLDAHQRVAAALSDPRVGGGCFRLSFDRSGVVLWLSALATRFGSRFAHFGDSAYFVRADLFWDVGGYRDLPILEDLDLWLRLRRRARLAVVSSAVVTSARRFARHGAARQQLAGILVVGLFSGGVRPSRLQRIYRRALGPGRDPSRRRFAEAWRRLSYPIRVLCNWTRSNVHLVGQTLHILDFMFWHRVGMGAVRRDSAWATGVSPHTGVPIWPDNIVFATQRGSEWLDPPETDAEIVTKIGVFMTKMVQRSLVEPEIRQGPARRMPHAVNLLHGAVQFNSGYLIFDDFGEAMLHLSDPCFLSEIKRFSRLEKRELVIVTRERVYDPEEFAWFVCFVRARLPWYANANGPTKKRVLWGTPSPYPAVNPINGSWVKDVRHLQRTGRAVARPPIDGARYFNGSYAGGCSEYSFLERFHAWAQHLVIRSKGFQGNLVFTIRSRIEPANLQEYQRSGGRWSASYPVSHPFQRIETARAMRRATYSASLAMPRM